MVIQRMMFDNRIGFSFSQSNFILIRTFRSLTAGKSKCTKLTKYGESLRSRWLASREILISHEIHETHEIWRVASPSLACIAGNINLTQNTRNSRNLRVASPSLAAVPSVCIPEASTSVTCALLCILCILCAIKNTP